MANIKSEIKIRFTSEGDKRVIRSTKEYAKGLGGVEKATRRKIATDKAHLDSIRRLNAQLKAQGGTMKGAGISSKLYTQALQGNRVAMEKIRVATKNYTTQLHRKNRTLLQTEHSTRILGGSFAVLRSRLLLASFAGSIFAMTIGKLANLLGEQEKAEKKLETALGRRSKTLLAFASAQQKVTTFGDEETITAMSLVGAYTENEKAIARLTEASMDLAVAKGIDLNSAVDLVSKSVFSSTNALSRYGVVIEGSTGSTQRLESAVKNISDLYGGQAKANAETFLGSILQLGNSAGDLGEKFGAIVAPAIALSAKSLKSFADSIDAEEIKAYGTAVMGVGLAWLAFTKGALIAQKAMLLLNKVSRKNIMIFGAMVAIGAAIDKFNLFADSTSDLSDEMKDLEGAIDDMMNKGKDSLSLTQKLAMSNVLLEQSYKKSAHSILNLFDISKDSSPMDIFTEEREIRQEEFRQALERHNVTAEEYGLGLVTNKEALIELNAITIKGAEAAVRQQNAQMKIVSTFAGALSQLNSSVKGSALISKRLAQVQATIDTYAAANKALAASPPPFNYIAMAAVIAAGFVNVKKIEAQTFAKGGEFITSRPEMIMVGESGRERVRVTPIDRPQERALPSERTINVNIYGGIVQEDYVRNELLPAINKAQALA